MSNFKEIKINRQLIEDLLTSIENDDEIDPSVPLEIGKLFAENEKILQHHILEIEEENRLLKSKVKMLLDALKGDCL